MAEYTSSWFQVVNFKGAFGESDWIKGWTLLSPGQLISLGQFAG